MKGCAGTCLLWVFLWALAGAAFYVYLREFGVLEPQLYWASGVSGLFVAICSAYAFNIATLARERRTLLDAAYGEPPQDGEWVAVSGPIRATHPLRAPLSGTPVVAYFYKIFERRRTSKGASLVTVYEGKGLTPGTIATRHGGVRLLAVPFFDLPVESVTSTTGIKNAEEYVAATKFQSYQVPKNQRVGVAEESTDDDGLFRVDRSFTSGPVVFENCDFQEYLVKQGETVCAFGLYSQEKRAIVPHPNWANQTRIMRGDAAVVAGQLRKRMVRYAIGIVLFASAVFVIFRLYENAAR